MLLKNIHSEDLLDRWKAQIKVYINELKYLKNKIIKLNKIREELLMIREELVSRNVEVDEMPSEPEEKSCQNEEA